MSAADTIFALSSGAGRAGIAVIRLSGARAGEALAALAGPLPPVRRGVLRYLRHPVTRDLLDQAVVFWMPGPSSATGEDVAELHVHGSAAVIDAVFAALISMPGLRLAEAGEFTRRAFRNDKLDLLEVEGLGDLLAAQSEGQRRQALFHMAGGASETYDSWLKRMTDVLARLEAAIDFIDEDGVAAEALADVRLRTTELVSALSLALAQSERAEVVRSGVRLAILGAPNVGKSSLLNVLAAREAAIVSPVPGTTRDVIEVSLMMAGLPVTVSDTAGLREASEDAIERLGMERARWAASQAHLVILLAAPDMATVEAPAEVPALRVMNKVDLAAPDSIHVRNDYEHRISVRTGEGVQELLADLERRVAAEYCLQEPPVVVRERHREAVADSIRLLNESLLHRPEQLELAAECVRGAARSLARITGRIDVEDLLGAIFSEFCVGK